MSLNGLPENWEVTKLGEVADYLNGRGFKKSEWESAGAPIIRIQNLNNAKASYNYTEQEFEGRYEVRNGDLLFAWAASLGTYIWKGEKAWLNQHIFKVVPRPNCSKLFLFYALEKTIAEFYAKSHGSGMVHITKGQFEATEIALPPIDEQERIVAKIEELFSELEAGVESLKKAQTQLKTYRHAVLKSAFEGKLTNENISGGEVPADWKLVKLADVSTSRLGKMLDRTKNVGDLQPYLRNINVRWGAFDLSNLLEMRFEKDEADKFGLKRGDLVICEGGEPGRAAIWKESDSPMKIQKALHRVRFSNTTSPTFFMYFLVYSAKSKVLDKYFTGTTIKHLTGESLRQIEFPLPPIGEQQRIVEEIESRLSVCDKLEETIAASLKQSEALRQSILKQAFEGKLVKTDEQ